MSAANFYSKNAAAVFAVTDRGIDCARLLTSGRRRGWSDVSSLRSWDRDRNYPALSMMEKNFSVDLPGGSVYDLGAVIVRRSAYYSGACLDWDVKSAAGSLTDFCGDVDDLADAITGEILADYEYYNGWNAGLIAIWRPKIRAAVGACIERISRESDALCAWSCDVKLRCMGYFSNGAGVYCRA